MPQRGKPPAFPDGSGTSGPATPGRARNRDPGPAFGHPEEPQPEGCRDLGCKVARHRPVGTGLLHDLHRSGAALEPFPERHPGEAATARDRELGQPPLGLCTPSLFVRGDA